MGLNWSYFKETKLYKKKKEFESAWQKEEEWTEKKLEECITCRDYRNNKI